MRASRALTPHFSAQSQIDGLGPRLGVGVSKNAGLKRTSASISTTGSSFQSQSMTRSSSVSISTIGRRPPIENDEQESMEDSHQRRYAIGVGGGVGGAIRSGVGSGVGVGVQSATPNNINGGHGSIEPPLVPRALFERIVRTQDLTVPMSHISTTRGGSSPEHFHIDRRQRVLPPPPPPLTSQTATPEPPPEPQPEPNRNAYQFLSPENADYLEALDRMARAGMLENRADMQTRRELLRPVLARQKDLSISKSDFNHEIQLKRDIERQLSTRRAQWQQALKRGDTEERDLRDEKPLSAHSEVKQTTRRDAPTQRAQRSPRTLPPISTRTRTRRTSFVTVLNSEAAPVDSFELQRRFRIAQQRQRQSQNPERNQNLDPSASKRKLDDASSKIEILDLDRGSGELYLRRPYVYKLSALPAVAGQYSMDGESTTEGVGIAREGLVSEADLLGRDEQRAAVYRSTVHHANSDLLHSREGIERARMYARHWPSEKGSKAGFEMRRTDRGDLWALSLSQDPDIRSRQLLERARRPTEPGREEVLLDKL